MCRATELKNGKLSQVIFWHDHHKYMYGCFLQRSIYHRKAIANSYEAIVGTTPYKLFLKAPWANKQLASSNFTYRTRKKAAVGKSCE
jgi:hypothetical protein